MKKNFTIPSTIYSFILLALFFGIQGFVQAQSIFTNPITGTNPNTSNPYTTGQTVNANITVSGIGRGAGIDGTSANDRYNANGWNTPSLDETAYFEWVITPNSGFQINLVSLVYTGQASGSGPTSFAIRSSADGFTNNIGTPTATGTTISLSGAAYQGITNAITFRLYAWNTVNSGGTFSVNDFTFNGSVVSIPTEPSIVSIETVNGDASEEGTEGTFRISRTGSTALALDVDYTIGGSVSSTDYSPALSGTITIPAGESFADIVITPINDNVVEGPETLTLTLVDGAAYDLSGNDSSSVNILDNDFAYLSVTPSSTTVSEGVGVYTRHIRLIILSDPPNGSIQEAATVQLMGSLIGSATFDDFTLLTTSVTFPAGSIQNAQQPFQVQIIDDALVEGTEFFDIAMVQAGYTGIPSIIQEGQVVPGFCSGNTNQCRNRQTIQILDNDLPDYTITTSGNAIVITDLSGNGETLDVTENGANIRFNATGRIYTINGGAGLSFPADVPLAGVNSITINTAGGDDIINIGGFTAAMPSLTINGGVGDDHVNFNGDITFAANANLDVDLQNDDPLPGIDQVTFANNTDLTLSGTGSATVKVSRNVIFNSGGTIEIMEGDLIIEANQQPTPTEGDFMGISLQNATLNSNTGNIILRGRGGNQNAEQIGITVNGSIIESESGEIELYGNGGPGSSQNYGVRLDSGSILRSTSSSAQNATLRIHGFGGIGGGVLNEGVRFIGESEMQSAGASIDIYGIGVSNIGASGVHLGAGGKIIGTNAASININGEGSNNFSLGVFIDDGDCMVSSEHGEIIITGRLLTPYVGYHGIQIGNPGSSGNASIVSTNSSISLITDILNIDPKGSVNAGNNLVVIKPLTDNGTKPINLGASSNDTHLGVTNTHLNQITAGTLIIGDPTSGKMTISSAITLPAAMNVELISGEEIEFLAGFNTSGGTLLLSAGAAPAVIKPTFNSTDVAASTLSFASDLAIVINGTTAGDGTGSTYTQLTVLGGVNLTGVELLLSGSYVPVEGNNFTIVDNDGVDAIIGIFNGLPEGATISNFLGSSLSANISYVGGDGNDVALYVFDPCASLTSAEADVIQPLCFGGSNGSASIAVTGGTPPYTYSWEDDPLFIDTLRTGLEAGNYKIYIEDATGCIDSLSFILGQPSPLSIELVELIDETCPEDADGSIEVSASGGTSSISFSWSNDESGDLNANLAAGSYTVTATDGNNCTVTETYQINTIGLDCCPDPETFGNILYVDANASGANNGSSWTDAYTDLQSALNNNCPGITEIWVAAGIYKPTSGTDRNISFVMKEGIAIYGGLIGNEPLDYDMSLRNLALNQTVLSGDLLGDDGPDFTNRDDNTHHVILNFQNGLSNAAILDGFTISGGQTLCCFNNSQGGAGMRNEESSPTVINCIFEDNFAFFGAGLLNLNCNATITNCIFRNNRADQNGGGLNNWANMGGTNNSIISNCLFLNNSGGQSIGAGGLININFSGICTPTIVNCTFFGNTGEAGGIHNFSSTPVITNCIIWGNSNGILNSFDANPVVSYSIVQQDDDIYPGVGNLNTNPFFINIDDENFSLQSCSPTINAGDNSAVPPGLTTDLNGDPRIYGNGIVDMGAYEFQGEHTPIFAVCDNPTLFLDNMGNATTAASLLDNGSTGCGTLSFTVENNSMLSFTCSDIGTNTLTLTVTDSEDQTSTCIAIVTIQDLISPSFDCPADMDVDLDTACQFIVPDLIDNLSGIDNCGTVSFAQNPVAGTVISSSHNETVSVTITASDGNGNSSTCSVTLTGRDNTHPTILCFNQTINFNGETSILLNPNDLVDANDNCGIESILLSPNSISSNQVGQIVPVLVTVTDVNGNSSFCTSQINIGGLPPGWSQNVNGVGCADGNEIQYNTETEVWTATSTNCFYGSPFTSDATAFAQRTLCGNGSITAQVTGISGTALGWAGVVMRESNAAGARKAQLTTNMSGNQSRREFRVTTNGSAFPQNFPAQNRYWLRIVRSGNQFILYNSPNGNQWFPVGSQTIAMGSCIEIGLVATNYSANSTVTATFANVSYTGNGAFMQIPNQANENLAAIASVQPDFSVYPNPTSGELNIDLKDYSGKNVQIELYSLEGKLMQLIHLDEVLQNTQTLQMDRYAAGMYFVKLKSAGLPDVTKRVVLTKG